MSAVEQYRVGFEAWLISKDLPTIRLDTGHYIGAIELRWQGWCAAMQQREASTEPSAIHDAALEIAATIAENYGPSRPIVTMNPSATITGRWFGEQAASENIAAEIRRRKAGAGALPDDAKDAARYRFLREAKWFKEGFAKTEPQASAFHYIGELLDSKIDAAIEAHKITGSGK
jgi:hypothetical protein